MSTNDAIGPFYTMICGDTMMHFDNFGLFNDISVKNLTNILLDKKYYPKFRKEIFSLPLDLWSNFCPKCPPFWPFSHEMSYFENCGLFNDISGKRFDKTCFLNFLEKISSLLPKYWPMTSFLSKEYIIFTIFR